MLRKKKRRQKKIQEVLEYIDSVTESITHEIESKQLIATDIGMFLDDIEVCLSVAAGTIRQMNGETRMFVSLWDLDIDF